MANATAPDTQDQDHVPTPVEDYWHAVYDILEWADGRQFLVEQPPLPLPSAA